MSELTTIYIGRNGDLSKADLERVVAIVRGVNEGTGLKDRDLQRIETALDSALMEAERNERQTEEER